MTQVADQRVADNGRIGSYEYLTDREQAILAHLPTRLTNDEIAYELYVSVNTVKGHLKNIYRKLGVSSRDWAVSRAREMGLLGGEVRRCACGTGWVIDHGPTAPQREHHA